MERAWPGGDWGYLVNRLFSLSSSLGMSFFALGFLALYLTVVTGSSPAKEETTPGMCLQRLYHVLSPLDIFPSWDMLFLCGLGWPGIPSITKLPLSWPPASAVHPCWACRSELHTCLLCGFCRHIWLPFFQDSLQVYCLWAPSDSNLLKGH